MLTKKQKQLILLSLVMTLVVGGLSWYLLDIYGMDKNLCIIPMIIVLFVGLTIATTKKNYENYEISSSSLHPSSEGCQQTINIYQNCNSPKPPSPPSPPSEQLTPEDVMNWLSKVGSELSPNCKKCVVNSVIRLWKLQTLQDIQKLSLEKQKMILQALLAFDCASLCQIIPDVLSPEMIKQWIMEIDSSLDSDCINCIIDTVMKTWTIQEFNSTKSMDKNKQYEIIQGLLAFNCGKCQDDKLNFMKVRNWVSSVMSGLSKDCFSCIVNSIMKYWSEKDFKKVNSMDKESQQHILQALYSISCYGKCVNIPSGLNRNDVVNWLSSVLVGEQSMCMNCVISAVLRTWSIETLKSVKAKPKSEQLKIAQGMIALHCQNECISSSTLNKSQVVNWIKNLVPKYQGDCSNCVVDSVLKMWNKEQFTEILSKPTSDQAKVVKLIADYNCPHVCPNEPLDDSNYSLY